MSLASLRSRAAFFRSDTDRALLSPSSREPARKRQRGRPVQRSELSELTSAQCPRASPSPSREQSLVLFSRPEQRPSADASDFVSFGGSDDELPDDSVSLAASEPEHWVGESDDPAPLPLLEPIDRGAGMDAELFRVLSKAVEELDLEWAPLEEPSRSRLDEWFLPGRRQAPQQRSAPFFPEVHEELAKSWRAPYSARLHTSHRTLWTSSGRVHRALHGSTKVFSSDETFPAQALELRVCSQPPQACAGSADETSPFCLTSCATQRAPPPLALFKQAHDFPETPGTPAQDCAGPSASEVVLIDQKGRGSGHVSLRPDHPESSLVHAPLRLV
ncbi:hypothetical protein DPX16_8178 [Anabarilius grahami]|uniref:Uncharacterized protein n=1 Tax=Anabarilius grahami TaxID=495550 RepID=A0A3N0Y7Z3_ANAGA|nr:hypothetical protein DPX16_8178 [Anabarilius grahami]